MTIRTETAPTGWSGAQPVARLLAALSTMAAMASEMSFLDHLEELRRRLIWSVVFVAAAFVGCWVFSGHLYDLASTPIRSHPAVTLAISRPQDIFSLHVKVTMVAAIFVSAPLVLTQAWLFISPGLYSHERRYAIPFVLFASLLFLCGGAFGYFIAFPTALTYLLGWIVASHLTPIIDAGEYFNLFFTLIVALGVVFQIPAVILVLSRIGIVTARGLIRHLKYAVFASVVVAAVITPTGDPANMLVIAAPMVALYGVGIGVAWLFGRRRVAPLEARATASDPAEAPE
jgi:sec-independent protein translocase protein TatC